MRSFNLLNGNLMKTIDKNIIKKNGYSLVEILVVLSIVALMTAMVVIAMTKMTEREKARECSAKLLMVHNAVNYYCLDNNLQYGSIVYETNLISSGLINSTDVLACPTTGESYQAVYTNGVIITCPSGLNGHVCNL